MKTIKICSLHQDYQVPLLWTFAFNGAEFWCPYCGRSEGMLGAGDDVKETEELIIRKELFKEASKKYLNAHSTLICAYLERDGQRIKPSDLPKEELNELREVATNGWQFEKQIEGVTTKQE